MPFFLCTTCLDVSFKRVSKQNQRVQEWALRLLYNDDECSFEELLKKDGSFTVHERNIQILLIEMFKAKNKLEPSLLQDIFEHFDYSGPTLRSSKYFNRSNVNTIKYGDKSLQNFGVILWNQLPREIQDIESLNEFKIFIKRWKPTKCPCDSCKVYVRGLGKVQICECENCQ